MTFILLAGVFAYIQMPKLEDPAVAVKQAMVAVVWPGADAHQVELQVAQPVEDALRTLPDVKKIKTECHDGTALFTVEFEMSVSMADLEQHFDLLRRKAGDVASSLPQGCYAPVVIDDMMDVYGIFYALTGDGYTYPELDRYAKLIRRELVAIKGVKRVNIAGGRDEVINIILNKEDIARNGMLPTQLMMALQQAGKTVNAGAYGTDGDRLRISESRLPNGGQVVEVSAQSLPPLESEPYDLPLHQTMPVVYFAPSDFRYAGTEGNMATWQDFGRWQYALLQGRDGLDEAFCQQLHALTDTCSTDRQRVRLLYDYLAANTRYVSIQLGIGGWQPIAAEEVHRTGFGDCKGLSNFMAAMLREVGVESVYTIISTRNERLLTDYASISQMNHAILQVPLPGDTLCPVIYGRDGTLVEIVYADSLRVIVDEIVIIT